MSPPPPAKATPPVRLFVYGSLKRGLENSAELRGATFEGESRTVAGYALHLVAGYPALVRGGGSGHVKGEVYRVSFEHLAQLDAFEGQAYRRAPVALADGTLADAYLMAAGAAGESLEIPGGRWGPA